MKTNNQLLTGIRVKSMIGNNKLCHDQSSKIIFTENIKYKTNIFKTINHNVINAKKIDNFLLFSYIGILSNV